MVSFTTLLSATALLGFTAAAPAPIYSKFRLRVQSPSSNPQLQGQYFSSYHTGAGMADATFTKNVTQASKLYFNGTSLLIDVGSTFPFALNAPVGDTNYARWEPMTITAGYGAGGEFANDVKQGVILSGQSKQSFGGWLVCEWYHGENVPQLFTAIAVFDGTQGLNGVKNPPATCANVKLIPEYIKG